jgi:hypothetical protein
VSTLVVAAKLLLEDESAVARGTPLAPTAFFFWFFFSFFFFFLSHLSADKRAEP